MPCSWSLPDHGALARALSVDDVLQGEAAATLVVLPPPGGYGTTNSRVMPFR